MLYLTQLFCKTRVKLKYGKWTCGKQRPHNQASDLKHYQKTPQPFC